MADGYSNFTPRRFFARSQSQRDSMPYRPREGLYDRSDVMYLVDETNTVHEEENELCFGLGNTSSSRSPLTSSSNGSMIETPQSLNVTSTWQDDVRVLLQQQQRLLLKVLSQQDEMKTKHDEYDKKIITIEEMLAKSSDSSSSCEKKKSRVPRELSVSQLLFKFKIST